MNCGIRRDSILAAHFGVYMALASLCFAQQPGSDVHLVFMEPDSVQTVDDMPCYKVVADTDRLMLYRKWCQAEPAQWAIRFYGKASRLRNTAATPHDPTATYYIALVTGGNQAAVGFRLRGDSGIQPHPGLPYIQLAPEDWVFTTTFLHETGHVVMYLLNNGRRIPTREIASIAHSTAALTDRVTAFDEGFAIHLETLAARFSNDPVVRQRYHHDRSLFGPPTSMSEYDRQAADLFTYSQTMIPEITDMQTHGWMEQRRMQPYTSLADFRNRSGLSGKVLAHLKFQASSIVICAGSSNVLSGKAGAPNDEIGTVPGLENQPICCSIPLSCR